MAPLLEVDDLKIHFPIKKGLFSKTVGHVYAVDGVSLRLHRGETLGLVGESGCGKTTAGLGILQLISSTGGTVQFNGEDIGDLGRTALRGLRREMQMIFQDPYSSLNPRMTVNQILNDPMEIHGLYPGGERQERIAFCWKRSACPPNTADDIPTNFPEGSVNGSVSRELWH